MTALILNLSRRRFVVGSAALCGGLILGLRAPAARAQAGTTLLGVLRIGDDGSVELRVDKSEMGQGAQTGLAMLVAEELEVEWSSVRVVLPVDQGPAGSLVTGASSSLRGGFDSLRRVGAAARLMLVQAGAAEFGVAPDRCEALAGTVRERASGRSKPYAELASRAAALPVPRVLPLKPRRAWRLIGTPAPRLDTRSKVDGSAIFGADVQVPGLWYAALALAPACGGALLEHDDAAARAVEGVRAIVPLDDGIAVVAERRWQAERGIAALRTRFAPGDFDGSSYAERLRGALAGRGVTALQRGEPEAELARSGARKLEAIYEVPFLAHATLEPMNCTARVDAEGCELWVPTQAQTRSREVAAARLGIPIERVRLHTTLLGGGFGRRFETDFVAQAVDIARAVGRPVQLLWTRAQDLQRDFYRPAYAARLEAVLGEGGLPVVRHHHVSGPSFEARDAPVWLQSAVGAAQRWLDAGLAPRILPGRVRNRLPWWVVEPVSALGCEGAELERYDIPHERVSWSLVECPVPLGFWRSVGHSQNAFFAESFIDELAHAAGADPLDYRRRLLARAPRARAVLELAAARAGWGTPLGAGRGRGVALHESFGTIVCQIAEVRADGPVPRVERVVCALDCGVAVNPDQIAAQMEGSIVFGLSAALHGEIQLERGSVLQKSFDDYPLVDLPSCPEIEVHRIESDASPGGVGEPGVPPIAPAVANGWFAATGRRLRRLPLRYGA